MVDLRMKLGVTLACIAGTITCAHGQAAGDAAASTWSGYYLCSTKESFFSKPEEVFRDTIRLRRAGNGFEGVRDSGSFMEKFYGSLDASGNVELVADGFWAGATGKFTALKMKGMAAGTSLFASGEREDKSGTRVERVLNCVIALSQDVDGPSETVVAEAAKPASPPEPEPQPAPAPSPEPAAVIAQPAPSPAPAAAPVVAAATLHRRALVIGNDGYEHVQKLAKARADAKAIATALQRAGFDVTLQTDLRERTFKETLRNFRARVGKGDEVVVYYAGHGVQLGGSNYLLPVDIRGENEEQVKDEAVPLQKVLDDLADRRAGFTLAIVDACRDNPFKSSGTRSIGTRGLAPTTAATGQMVIFSAGSGQQALDTLGPQDRNPNGVFTRVFLGEMEQQNVTVDRVLRNVRTKVVEIARSIGHEQTPALYDQAIGDFYLFPGVR